MRTELVAGAGCVDITPRDSQFLFGYPHVARYSTGVHDPLLCSALYLSDGRMRLMFISADIIFVSKQICRTVRRRIETRTGISPEHILISATHTHSGPITVDYISNRQDPVVPNADDNYISYLQDRLVEAAEQAFQNAQWAKIGLATADSTGIGTHRHDPSGPADHEVPVLLVKSCQDDAYMACLLVCSMHPTVLHEDSTLISADFPGMARKYLQMHYLGSQCPVLHHTGPAGNQSPRHVTAANTFAEADRLGHILGEAVIQAIAKIEFVMDVALHGLQSEIDLPRRSFPSVATAQSGLVMARSKLDRLRLAKAARQDIRTAECDWFGAEETLALAEASQDRRLEDAYRSCLPVEIQIFRIGPWTFCGWPGEIFVEYSLALKKAFKRTFIISLANGELQGYLVTPEAASAGSYEAANALFSHTSGQMMLDTTVRLLEKLHE